MSKRPSTPGERVTDHLTPLLFFFKGHQDLVVQRFRLRKWTPSLGSNWLIIFGKLFNFLTFLIGTCMGMSWWVWKKLLRRKIFFWPECSQPKFLGKIFFWSKTFFFSQGSLFDWKVDSPKPWHVRVCVFIVKCSFYINTPSYNISYSLYKYVGHAIYIILYIPCYVVSARRELGMDIVHI